MTYGRILVPVDGSAACHAALQEAVRFVAGRNCEVELVHVVQLRPLRSIRIALAWPIETDPARARARRTARAQGVHARLRNDGQSLLGEAEMILRRHGLTPQCAMVEAMDHSVARMVARHCEKRKADLLIVGMKRRAGFMGIRWASTAEQIIRVAPVPVVVVHSVADIRL